MAALCCVLSLCATSCNDSIIYENEGDCSPHVQFVFKKHRQALHSVAGRESDAFYSSVTSVHLFVFDEATDQLVLEKIEKTENLQSAQEIKLGSGEDRCFMSVDLKPGKYRFIAWCGLDDNDHNNAFQLHDDITKSGAYKECRVKTDASTGHPFSTEKYESLYHGKTEGVEITITSDNSTIIPVELTKDTNDIAVWVQHMSKSMSDEEYEIVYTDANGSMHFDDNSISDSRKLEYHAHTRSVLESNTEFNGETVKAGALVAHISTARLMQANKNDARLEVRHRPSGTTVFSIPLIQYLLQMQTFTIDGQYYLDCEDTYNCSFYLTGEDEALMPYQIIINNWVIVPEQNSDI